MKAILSLILLLSISACKHKEDKDGPFGNWQIQKDQFTRITGTARPPDKPPMVAFNRNKNILKKIENKYPPSEYKYEWIKGVYGTEDIDRYKSTRKSTVDVSGFETQVLLVTKIADKTDPFYFDIMYICPPPTGTCDLTDNSD